MDVLCVSQPEEVPDGSLHAGFLLLIPIDTQDQLLQMPLFPAGDGGPDVVDLSRALQLGQYARLARLYAIGVESVSITAGRVIAGHPGRDEVFERYELCEGCGVLVGPLATAPQHGRGQN